MSRSGSFLKRSTSGQFDVTSGVRKDKLTGTDCFKYTSEQFEDMIQNFNEKDVVLSRLAQLGGVRGIAYGLFSHIENGITAGKGGENSNPSEEFPHRTAAFGLNCFTQAPPTSFWDLCLEALDDHMLKLLIVAGIVNVIVGSIDHPESGWIEGVAVLLAVSIVTLVTAINDMAKEKKFREMDQQNQVKKVFVVRDGQEIETSNQDLVVGDLVLLKGGSEVPADGLYCSGTDDLKVDESALTGESIEIAKSVNDPLFLSGTAVSSGNGLMLVLAVGDRSYQGKMLASLQEKREDTPLQKKLTILGDQIGMFGGGAAVMIFLILTIVWLIGQDYDEPSEILTYFIIAVTIVVVAVPEGLPLAVTLSLAYSMNKMMDDNNFVRVLSACETMGNATTICSDKTGTLTTNQMTVTKAQIGLNVMKDIKVSSLSETFLGLVQRCIVVNSEASLQDDAKTGGKRLAGANQTECALLRWAMDLGVKDLDSIRNKPENKVLKFYPFHSKLKRSAVLIQPSPESYVMYVKGAAERILDLCDTYFDEDGKPMPMGEYELKKTQDAMDAMTRSGLRCIGLAIKTYNEMSFDEEGKVEDDPDVKPNFWKGYTWLTVCGIKDPVRPEVPLAVRQVQQAGVVVRMVTGDHIETAKFIARECGILSNDNHVCMTGAQFRALTDEEKEERLPNLRVLARSNPQDKETLVKWYKEDHPVRRNGQLVLDNDGNPRTRPADVVAVTGDGANDALALKSANVGLSMGIQGTDVAKRASDIVIMDDNFASIVKTVMWGRSVFDNIRKFVQFQLTVNVVALTMCLFGPATGESTSTPLTAVQLLWVNLIMDTLAALALATERPTEELLERHPYKPTSHLISPQMWTFVFGHAFFQLPILFVLLLLGDDWFDNLETDMDNLAYNGRNEKHLTVVFNAFVWLQIFNEINARRVNGEWNVCSQFFANWYFSIILVITAAMQTAIVYGGGKFTSTRFLSVEEYFFTVAIGSTSLFTHQLVRFIPGGLHWLNMTLFGKDDYFETPFFGSVKIDAEFEFGVDEKYALESDQLLPHKANDNEK